MQRGGVPIGVVRRLDRLPDRAQHQPAKCQVPHGLGRHPYGEGRRSRSTREVPGSHQRRGRWWWVGGWWVVINSRKLLTAKRCRSIRQARQHLRDSIFLFKWWTRVRFSSSLIGKVTHTPTRACTGDVLLTYVNVTVVTVRFGKPLSVRLWNATRSMWERLSASVIFSWTAPPGPWVC